MTPAEVLAALKAKGTLPEPLRQENIATIRALVQSSAVKHLLDLMEGNSVHSSPRNPGAPEYPASILWRMAIEHVRFVVRFGADKDRAEVDGRFHRAYAEDFDAWLTAGAPGLLDAEVDALRSAGHEGV